LEIEFANYLPGLPSNQISASKIARIIGVSHWYHLLISLYQKYSKENLNFIKPFFKDSYLSGSHGINISSVTNDNK
jgi:hypothetical protein